MKPDKEILDSLFWKIEDEGFEYTFVDYSDWKEIEDLKFREYLNDYLQSRQVLHNYLKDWGVFDEQD